MDWIAVHDKVRDTSWLRDTLIYLIYFQIFNQIKAPSPPFYSLETLGKWADIDGNDDTSWAAGRWYKPFERRHEWNEKKEIEAGAH
jgi:hypothetical protein